MGWERIKMGDFLSNRDLRFKPKDPQIKGLKRIEKIDFSGNIYISEKPSNTDMILIKKGDLVISGINVEKGAMAVYQGEDDITATIHYSSYEFDSNKIDLDFLKNFLRSKKFVQAIKEQVPGGIKTEIKPKHLLPLEVEIPTRLDEQRKAVNKLQNKNTKILSIYDENSLQLDSLKKLRQQILQDAVQGKLVPQDPSDEPASMLLERIKAEKEKLILEKKIKKDKALPEIKPEEIPFEIPESWVWCKLGKLVLSYQNGISKRNSAEGDKVVVLRLADIYNGEISLNEVREIKLTEKELVNYLLDKDDILITRVNGSLDIVGNFTLVKTYFRKLTVCDHFIRMRLTKHLICSKYIHLLGRIRHLRLSIENNFKTTSGQKTINQGHIDNIIIPLPPLPEQNRIVAKIEQLMKLCDELEQGIQQNQKYTQELLQVALREALE